MMETDPVFEMACLIKLERIDSVHYNGHVYCSTPLSEETFVIFWVMTLCTQVGDYTIVSEEHTALMFRKAVTKHLPDYTTV
jgi:hypothetical protein